MTSSHFFCLILMACLSICFSSDSGTNPEILIFDYETRCMPKCLECQKGPNSCTKCASGFDCCNYACQKCSNQTQCQSCLDGFELDPNLNICVFQFSCITDTCLKCDEEKNICALCDVAYFLNIEMKTCEPCSAKCIKCVNAYECVTCQEGTFKQDGACKPCIENCLACRNSSICDSCASEYFINEYGKCQKCADQCKKCTSKKNCLECNPGHYFDENLKDCVPCIRPCYECKSPTQCTSCEGDYIFNKTTEKCQACDEIISHCNSCQVPENMISLIYESAATNVTCQQCDDRYFLENSQCKLCSEHCAKCKNASYCTQCSENYFVDDKNLCQVCPIFHCFICQNSTVCRICSTGTYWNPAISKNQCTKCSAGCSSCDQFACNQCDSGYFWKNGNCYKCDSSCVRCEGNALNCQACSTGYFKTTFMYGHCYKCPEPCVECKNSTYCTKCLPRYSLFKNTCKKCKDQNCDQCKSTESNMTSNSVFLVGDSIESTQKCIRCALGYILRDQRCIKCFDGCQRCMDLDSCIECSPGLYLSNNNTKCLPCSKHCLKCNFVKESFQTCLKCEQGYSTDYSSSVCIACDENCLQCVPNTCFDCKDGYFLERKEEDSSQTCQKCKPPCKSCQDEVKCLSCVIGYYLTPQDTCVKCQQGCEECNEDGCFICETTYRLNYENSTCSKCKVEKCSKCQTSELLCDICEDGYQQFQPQQIHQIIGGNPLCFRCDEKISGCKKCSSPKICTQCFFGLELGHNEDKSETYCDQEQQKSPLELFIVIGCLSLLALVLISIICFLKRKIKRVKGQKEDNEDESLIEDHNNYSINSEEVVSDKHLRRSLRSSFGDYQK